VKEKRQRKINGEMYNGGEQGEGKKRPREKKTE